MKSTIEAIKVLFLTTCPHFKKAFSRSLLLLFLLFSAKTAYADYGTVMLHKAKFVLKNGIVLTGFVPMPTYNVSMEGFKNFDKDKAFQKLLNQYYFTQAQTLHFQVYKNYHTLVAPKIAENGASLQDFIYTDSASVNTLHLDSIKYTIYLNGQEKPSLLWRQIEVFDSTLVQTMQNPPSPENYLSRDVFESPNFYVAAHFFCFNANISQEQFKVIIQNFGQKMPLDQRSERGNYAKEVFELAKLGIAVFFHTEGSC